MTTSQGHRLSIRSLLASAIYFPPPSSSLRHVCPTISGSRPALRLPTHQLVAPAWRPSPSAVRPSLSACRPSSLGISRTSRTIRVAFPELAQPIISAGAEETKTLASLVVECRKVPSWSCLRPFQRGLSYHLDRPQRASLPSLYPNRSPPPTRPSFRKVRLLQFPAGLRTFVPAPRR